MKIADIDSGRMLIRVEQGKGGRDRYLMLSPRHLGRTERRVMRAIETCRTAALGGRVARSVA